MYKLESGNMRRMGRFGYVILCAYIVVVVLVVKKKLQPPLYNPRRKMIRRIVQIYYTRWKCEYSISIQLPVIQLRWKRAETLRVLQF